MQCNQSFCGNGFTSVPQAPIYRSPLQCNQNICPEIVGEGEVTSLTLPDGTVQFFFMPTVKWWSTGPVQCQPTYTTSANPMFANMNCSNPCNNNMGSWYIRGISNPLSQNVFNPSCNRNDQPKTCFASDYNMNCVNSGYHVKFHNDNCTSTTDLQYFYPNLRQGGCRPPSKDTAAVQISTVPANNTTICYEVVCAKPCNCARPMSLESLVETKLTSPNTIGTPDCSCDDLNKKNVDIQPKKQKENKRALKLNNTCACESTDKTSVDKSITTYADQCICCAPTDGQGTQTREKKKKKDKRKQTHESLNTDSIYKQCNGNDAEIWQPATPMSQKAMEDKSSETLLDSSDSSSCSCCSD